MQSFRHYPGRVGPHNADLWVFEFSIEVLSFDFVSLVEPLHSQLEVLKTKSYLSEEIQSSFKGEV